MKKFKRMGKMIISIMLILSITVSCTLIANAKTYSKANIISDSLNEVLKSAKPNQEIPVCIWYQDIDQNLVNETVSQETQISIDELADISGYNKTRINNTEDLNDYIKNTQKVREKEQKLTDEYITARRAISRNKYSMSAETIIEKLSVSDNNIIFKSQYAPMLIVKVKAQDIDKFVKIEAINSIDYFEEPIVAEPTKSSISVNTGYNELYSKLSLTGDGVKVGMIEVGYPEPDDELDLTKIENVGNVDTRSHATNTAKILVGSESGFATGIDLYSTNASFENIETMLSLGVQLINVSFGWLYSESDTSSNYAESYYDRWFNHIVSYHNVTVVASAGNNGEDTTYKRVLSPAMASNVIAVGAFDDKNTNDINDDVLYSYSSYKNINGTVSGVEKPDVVMPANIGGGGTSSSAPILTAMLALMFELKPSVAAFPQAVKAIVLASCHHKVSQTSSQGCQELIEDGITDRQGAGVPDALIMAKIICQGTYGCKVFGGNESIVDFVQPSYDADKMNVSISWLKEDKITGSHYDNPQMDAGQSSNLDLFLYQNDSVISSSTLSNSAAEMCYVTLSSSPNYRMKIKQNSSLTNVRFGYAWSTDDKTLTPVSQEGIYYIRNAANNRFLTYSTTTNSPVMLSASNQANITDAQKWIIKNSNNCYNILSGYESVTGNISQDLTLTTTYYKAAMGTSPYDIRIIENSDGSVSFTNYEQNLILTYYGTSAVWVNFNDNSTIDSKQKWYLEKVNYLRGDANADGMIMIDDATFVQRYLARLTTANNIQQFLSDADYNGEVDIFDATEIQLSLVR